MPRVMTPMAHHSAAARGAAATAEAFVAGANGLGTIIRHGVSARRRVAILGHGLSDLLAIGRRLSPRVTCAQQCNSNRNEDPRHVDCFLLD